MKIKKKNANKKRKTIKNICGVIIIGLIMLCVGTQEVSGYYTGSFYVTPKTTSPYFGGFNTNELHFTTKNGDYAKSVQPTSKTEYIPLAPNGYGLESNKGIYPDSSGKSYMMWSTDGRKSNQTFGYKATNCRKWNDETRTYEYVDVVNIVTSWKNGANYKRTFGPYVAVRKSPNLFVRTSGINDITFSVYYYKAGTSIPIKLKTNGTVVDIDDYQMVAISPIVDYITYKGSYLDKHVSKTAFACFRHGNITPYNPRTAFGYVTNSHYLKVEFGDNKYVVGSSSEKKTYNTIWGNAKGHKYFEVGASSKGVVLNNVPDIKPYIVNLETTKTKENGTWNKGFNGGEIYLDDDLIIGAKLRDLLKTGQKTGDEIISYYEIYKEGKLLTRGESKTSSREEVEKGNASHIISETLEEIGTGNIEIHWYATDNVPDYGKRGPIIVAFHLKNGEEANLEVKGEVEHLPQWNENRNIFNQYYYNKASQEYLGNELKISMEEYVKDHRLPRERYANVFWPGEEFVLKGEAGDGVHQIKVTIENSIGDKSSNGKEHYETWLTEEEDGVWTGTLWDSSMIGRGGKDEPELIYAVFTSYRKGEPGESFKVPVIIDNYRPFWDLNFQL